MLHLQPMIFLRNEVPARYLDQTLFSLYHSLELQLHLCFFHLFLVVPRAPPLPIRCFGYDFHHYLMILLFPHLYLYPKKLCKLPKHSWLHAITPCSQKQLHQKPNLYPVQRIQVWNQGTLMFSPNRVHIHPLKVSNTSLSSFEKKLEMKRWIS